jgi:hypothetical protein
VSCVVTVCAFAIELAAINAAVPVGNQIRT